MHKKELSNPNQKEYAKPEPKLERRFIPFVSQQLQHAPLQSVLQPAQTKSHQNFSKSLTNIHLFAMMF